MSFAAESRVDTLTEADVHHMARNGCKGFYVGIESGSQKVLDLMNKKITVEQIRRFCGWCRDAGIKIYASYIAGFPGETEDDFQQTESLINEIAPAKRCRNVFLGMPGSDITNKMLDTGE